MTRYGTLINDGSRSVVNFFSADDRDVEITARENAAFRMIETIVSAVGDNHLKDWRVRFSLEINTDFKSYYNFVRLK